LERDERRRRDYTFWSVLGIGIISLSLSLCDDFFNEQRFCDDAKRANFDAHEYENQQKENHLFCRKHEKRKDEKRFVFFVFVTFTTLFSHNKEGV
jgi:hypothetical protein